MPGDAPITVIFDGVCKLCDVTVRYLRRWDSNRQFRYISFQSEEGTRILSARGVSGPPDTVYVITHDQQLVIEDRAMIYLFSRLGSLHRLLSVLIRTIPPPLRRSLYKWVSRNRYRVFGKVTSH